MEGRSNGKSEVRTPDLAKLVVNLCSNMHLNNQAMTQTSSNLTSVYSVTWNEEKEYGKNKENNNNSSNKNRTASCSILWSSKMLFSNKSLNNLLLEKFDGCSGNEGKVVILSWESCVCLWDCLMLCIKAQIIFYSFLHRPPQQASQEDSI